MADPHTNFGYSTVATAPSPASSGTSLVVQAGDGAKFPSSGSFNATVWPASTQPTTANSEIVRVTAISTDTFTIIRAQESTSARTIVVGDQIADTITAKTLTDVELNVYVTDQNKTIPATTQVIFDDYLEVAASFFYELSADAILMIGDFATPLSLPDQNPNIFVTLNNETVPQNSEVVFSDYYELSAPFTTEIASNGELQVGTGSPVIPGVIGLTQYAPAATVTYNITGTSNLAVVDAANLTVAFTVPASGNAVVTFSAVMAGAGGNVLGLGLLNHGTGAQVGSTLGNVATASALATVTVVWYLNGLASGSLLQLDIAAVLGSGSTGTTGKIFAQGVAGIGGNVNSIVGPAVIVVQPA